MAGNQYFRRSISLVLLIPKCPCLWAIWIILSLSDSGGKILSFLRISPSAMYSSALRSKLIWFEVWISLGPFACLNGCSELCKLSVFCGFFFDFVQDYSVLRLDSGDDIFLETVIPCLRQWVSGHVVSHVGFTRDVNHFEAEVLHFQGESFNAR